MIHEIIAVHHERTIADFQYITLHSMQRLQCIISYIFLPRNKLYAYLNLITNVIHTGQQYAVELHNHL